MDKRSLNDPYNGLYNWTNINVNKNDKIVINLKKYN
jgi:hypothetical protein